MGYWMRLSACVGGVVAALVLTGCDLASLAASAAGTPNMPESVTVESGWQTPEALPDPVNTAGWEDSPQVTPDGNAIYFTYFRIDPILHGTKNKVRLGPRRANWPADEPFDSYGAELYVARKVNGRWQSPQHLPPEINFPEDAEGDVWISADEQRILFTNGDGSARRKRGIYFASKEDGRWRAAVLASSIGFPFEPGDENPHLTLDEDILFFESKRHGGRGKEDIWMSRKVNGAWEEPVNLGPNVNTRGTEGSPFSLDGKVLYWDDKGAAGIYRSVLQDDGTWGPRERVVSGHVGDPSMTRDGDLYFCKASVVRGDDGKEVGFDSSIMVSKQRR